jgi:hypothetical protein
VRGRYVAIGGVVAGATFLWLIPPFATCADGTSSLACALLVGAGLGTVVAYAVASWGLLRAARWWPGVAALAGILGLLATALYAAVARPAAVPVQVVQVVLHLVLATAALAAAGLPRLRRTLESPDGRDAPS